MRKTVEPSFSDPFILLGHLVVWLVFVSFRRERDKVERENYASSILVLFSSAAVSSPQKDPNLAPIYPLMRPLKLFSRDLGCACPFA